VAYKKGEKHEKHVIVAGEDGELYRLDRESGNLVLLDREDPIRHHASRLIEAGVATADVTPHHVKKEGAATLIGFFYHLVNLTSFNDPDADDD